MHINICDESLKLCVKYVKIETVFFATIWSKNINTACRNAAVTICTL